MTLQSLWDIICPLMGSGEVNDFSHGLGMNRGHTGMCLFLSMRVHVFLCVFPVCQCGRGAVINLGGKSERTHC